MSAHGRHGRLLGVAALLAIPALALAGPAHATAESEAGESKKSSKQSSKEASKRSSKQSSKEASSKAEASAPEPGKLEGGKVVKQGWWARSNEPAPETGLFAPPSVPALAAPKGTLPVAQVAGEPERIAALEIALDGKADSIVESAVLVLRESVDPTASPNAAEAAIVACPITESFWVGAENGQWTTKPDYDCEIGMAPGVRNELGVWTFDLTVLAADWLKSDSDMSPAVVLTSAPPAEGAPPTDPAAAAPSSFQVAFDTASVGLLAKTTEVKPPKDESSEPEEDTSEESDDDSSTSAAGATGGGSSGSGGSVGDVFSSPVDAGSPADTGSAPLPAAAPAADAAAETVSPMAAPTPMPWHADLNRALFLLPVVAILAYLCMLALGPAGQPVPGQGRRGVSRALERLRATDARLRAERGRA